jgi:hypothetical protein
VHLSRSSVIPTSTTLSILKTHVHLLVAVILRRRSSCRTLIIIRRRILRPLKILRYAQDDKCLSNYRLKFVICPMLF